MHRFLQSMSLVCLACTLCLPPPTAQADDVLPDLIAWAHDASVPGFPNRDLVYGGFFDFDVQGKVLYRFPVALANDGDGPLQVVEVTAEVDGVKTTQTITQQILQSGGGNTFRDEEIGTFPYPPEVVNGFGHLRLPGLAQYNLYTVDDPEVEPDENDTPVRTTDKLSMGIVDSIRYVPFPSAPRTYFSANADVLGISVEWVDLYSAGLPGQFIDVTGLADGQYWLEVQVDPYNRILETDDTNNKVAILVNLIVPDPRPVGDFNGDYVVNLADYTVWRDTLGTQVANGTAADADGDSFITASDYFLWKQNFGQFAPMPLSSSTSIPEPSSVALLLLAALGWRNRARVPGL